MKKTNIFFIWTFTFIAQFVNILSSCQRIHVYKYYYEYNKCNFEYVYDPLHFPINAPSNSYNIRYTNINIDRSFVPKLRRTTFSLNARNVTELEITNSQLVEIDLDGLTIFPDLRKLHLTHNNLTQINPVFHAQTYLNELSLSNNSISKIDVNAFKNTPLITLNLSFNNLSNVDSKNESGKSPFSSLNYLRKLDLSNNKLEAISRWTFSNISDLRYLNLSKNCITEVKLRVFDKLSNLVSLNLSSNLISSLDLGFSIGLKSLETLDLSFNRLSVLDPNVFHNTPMLSLLQLHNNLLKNISISEMRHSTRLTSISIHDNNIECLVLYKILLTLKLYKVNVDEGLENESYSVHGISCNIQSTTDKPSIASTHNFENSYTEPSLVPPPRKHTVEDFEKIFLNSTLHTMLSDIVNNLEILTKVPSQSSVESKHENMLLETLKELNLKLKSENGTTNSEVMRNLSVSISEDLQNVLTNFMKDNKAKNSEENRQLIEHFDNLQKVLMNVMNESRSKNAEITPIDKPSVLDIFNAVFQIVIISLLVLIIYLSYHFFNNYKTARECKEMQPII